MNINKNQKCILVIDDDPVQTRLLEKRLSENGYKVLTATEAADGLQIAMNRTPDLIVLDIMMPIINGYNLCQILKNEEKHKNIPIIILTARDKEKDKEIGQDVGANAYLTKPVDIPDLLKTMAKFLDP